MSFVDVVGAGRIGHGIALCVAMHGFRVRLRDVKHRTSDERKMLREKILSQIQESLRLFEECEFIHEPVDEVVKRIVFADGYDGLEDAFHVVEAVPEDAAVKKQVYSMVCERIGSDALLASTSSSMRPSSLAKHVKHPERFLVTHWINPAELIPLVEVAPAPQTSRETVEEAVEFLRRCGKRPVVCGDSPGYVSARLQAALMNEALRLVEEGVASPHDVDEALMVGIGFRLSVHGLLEFVDWGGVDILYRVDEYLAAELNAERFRPPALLRKLVEEGRLGMHVGRGVFDYGGIDIEALKLSRKKAMVKRLKQLRDEQG
ncbi:MAG: 3-hydroxyacyl-CoA dehydrogenase NAD-binding domain-containing protein [Candidatus Caldarchaeum sp.]|nr:3-hydroxyacyl-CoA dehydrogenase NAD-binding domain-containing protein [Candidatus Caldarchaeales archaeon]MDJ0272348.1 3-hydroxyacyl-CoA dehydrogenase NAD-binding domain-containing protein [Candidatus Caldarchaeales archaeon]